MDCPFPFDVHHSTSLKNENSTFSYCLSSIGHSGGWAFRNYNFEKFHAKDLKFSDLANEIIHASQLMFVDGEKTIPTGLLIASDWHLKDRLLHLTIEEFTKVSQRVLDDEVQLASDQWDPGTGKVKATRE
jgi:hypothetical protein